MVNSNIFTCIYLPAIIIIYHILSYLFKSEKIRRTWLIISSLIIYFFLSSWCILYILISFLINYLAGTFIIKKKDITSKPLYVLALIINILFWIYSKYKIELADAYSFLFATDNTVARWIMPLGFGFITLQQILFLTECYKKQISKIDILDYLYFSTFFPKLIAGPITSYQRFQSEENGFDYSVNYKNIAIGSFLFFLGLTQKVLFADTFLVIADRGIASHSLNFVQAWITSLCNTFGLFFNINGYTSMAIGLGLCFNISLPPNFNQPFKALNIKDFWTRWHISFISNFTNHILTPIARRKPKRLSYALGIFITFFVISIWHKLTFTMIVWGLLNAFALVIYSLLEKIPFKLPKFIAWIVTFGFINISWIFFRTDHITQALIVISGLVNIKGLFMYYNEFYILWGIGANFMIVLLLIASLFITLKIKFSRYYKPSIKMALITILMIIFSITFNNAYPFIYYGF